MNGITNMVGSLLTYGIGHIDSSLKEYQVIFLFFGVSHRLQESTLVFPIANLRS